MILKIPISPVALTWVTPGTAEGLKPDDADDFRILLAEERHGARIDRFVERHDLLRDLGIFQDLIVDQAFDDVDLFPGQGSEVCIVEA